MIIYIIVYIFHIYIHIYENNYMFMCINKINKLLLSMAGWFTQTTLINALPCKGVL